MKGPAIFGSKRVISLCRMSVLLAFLALFSLPEPLEEPEGHEGARLRWKFKIDNSTYRLLLFFCRKSCLDVGSNRDEYPTTPRMFSHLPATQSNAESRRSGSKGILIGSQDPYAERHSTGGRGGLRGETTTPLVLTAALVPRTGHMEIMRNKRED